MTRLIDADALKKSIADARDKRMEEKPYGWEWEYNAYNHCIMLAGSLSVREPVDAVPVIRCKDCKHWHTDYCPMAYREYEHGRGNEPKDYCSLAERKEE